MSSYEDLSLHPILKIIRKIGKLHDQLCMPATKAHRLTRNEADVLLFLSSSLNHNTAMDIVRHRLISKSLVSKSIESLISRGFVEVKTDDVDRRYNHLYITPQAQDAVSSLTEAQSEFFRIVSSTVTSDERAMLLQVLQKISCKMDEFL